MCFINRSTITKDTVGLLRLDSDINIIRKTKIKNPKNKKSVKTFSRKNKKMENKNEKSK